LKHGLSLDPDHIESKKTIKNIRKSKLMKEEASALFKKGKIKEALEKFKECLT
jgi:hypothetical protein